jgi:replication factor C subunit 2/4
MRQAINNLQSTFNGYGNITVETLYKLCDRPNYKIIQDIFRACIKKELKAAFILSKSLQNAGYSNFDIIIEMGNTLKSCNMDFLNQENEIEFGKRIFLTIINISKGMDTNIQLYGCISKLCLI